VLLRKQLMTEQLNILSLNTNGLGEVRKRQSMLGWLKNTHKAQNKIIFLQETHTTKRTETIWKNEWKDWDISFSSGDSSSKGVATFFPKSMDYKIHETISDPFGRYVAIYCTICNKDFCLINCYAPNTTKPKDQLKWLEKIHEIIQKYEETNIIIGGDLNDCFKPHLDRYRCKPGTKETEYIQAWKTICERYNLADIWRTLNPDKRSYTWRQGSSATRLKQSRLDYWIASAHLMYDLQGVDIKPSIRSDHSLINIDLYKSEQSTRGPSYWRFNASLLNDRKYIEEIKLRYNMALEKYNDIDDKGLKWDLIKMEIRSSTICFSKTKGKETREKLKEATTQVNKL
jgi:exonuclease III